MAAESGGMIRGILVKEYYDEFGLLVELGSDRGTRLRKKLRDECTAVQQSIILQCASYKMLYTSRKCFSFNDRVSC